MGRGNQTTFDSVMVFDLLRSLGKKPFSMIFLRYKYIVLLCLCFLGVWGLAREPTKPTTTIILDNRVEERHKEYPDFGELKSHQDKDLIYDEGLNPKHDVHQNYKKNVELSDRQALLEVPEDNEIPQHDLQNNNKHSRKKTIPRQRQNTVNGVPIPPVSTVDWVAQGGADIYRIEELSPAHDEFRSDFEKQVPGLGDGGVPVVLYGREKFEGEEIMKTEAFNLVASDKIPFTRVVPDTRDPRCQAVVYDSSLPTTSVIIIFTNEAWSPLIRTIYSVLNKSPAENIQEIILVDDFSDKAHLGGKLERFIRKYFPSKVKLLRLKSRQGLIRARLVGARAATGDVLLFLDSHCECNTGWLEPLLQRIKENPLAFVVPIIDVIDDKTMEYYHGNGNYFQVGGFTWSGHFTWIDISQQEIARRGSQISPTRSPTMAGGLFAVSTATFWALGSYDEEMDVWGGENLEMSFRIWQCGAVLETIPCSRVGHIFRSFHPYSFPGNKDTHGINTARTVEVWMDDYKKLFYMHRPDLLSTSIGSLDNRRQFRSEKQCKPFSWFLENIYPEKFILNGPDQVYAYGRLRNPNTDTCLDNMQNEDSASYTLGQYACHKFMASAQFFSFSRQFELRREDTCAQVTAPFPALREPVEMGSCLHQGGPQEWAHTKEGKIIHKETRKCLDSGVGGSAESLVVAPCQNIPSQTWFFDHYIQA